MIQKRVHQIYGFWDNTPYQDIPCFQECVSQTIAFCKAHGLEHTIWSPTEIETLLKDHYPQYLQVYQDFTQVIMKCDFARYIILYHYGGIYIDMDIIPVKPFDFMKETEIFTTWDDDSKRLPYNAVMGSQRHNELFLDIAEHSKESFYEKSKSLPESWKGRLVFHSTGHLMLKRILTRKNIKVLSLLKLNRHKYRQDKDFDRNPEADNYYFIDYNLSSWYFKY